MWCRKNPRIDGIAMAREVPYFAGIRLADCLARDEAQGASLRMTSYIRNTGEK